MSYPFQHSTRIPFPTDALPPKIRNAVEEGIRVIQAPPALIASSALAAASHAVQSKFDVERLNGLKGPCSAYFIVIAESGERKSATDDLYFSAAREFEEIASKENNCIVSTLIGDCSPAGTIAHMDHYVFKQPNEQEGIQSEKSSLKPYKSRSKFSGKGAHSFPGE